MVNLTAAATDKNSAYYSWLQFLADPLGTLNRVSLIVRNPATQNFSGSCIVAGEVHADAVTKRVLQGHIFETVYSGTTNVASLNVAPGGKGATYWFPYAQSSVGECDIDFHAPVGTVALTAGMNGCSLRLYVDTRLGILKFCHDNNGLYADDVAYHSKGFDHLFSINADMRTRGLPNQNINNYWKVDYDSPGTGVYFISVKTDPARWTIYKSVVIGSYATEIIPAGTFSKRKTKVTQGYSGNQGENGLVGIIDIPPINREIGLGRDYRKIGLSLKPRDRGHV